MAPIRRCLVLLLTLLLASVSSSTPVQAPGWFDFSVERLPHHPGFPCTKNSECGHHYQGTCVNRTCSCTPHWLEPSCVTPFCHDIPNWWIAVQITIGLVQGSVFLLSLLDILIRYRTSRADADTSSRRAIISNPRDFAFFLNTIAAMLRLIWLVDPLGLRGWYSPLVHEVTLMRLPQLLWVVGYVAIGLVWIYVSNSFTLTRDRLQRHTKRMRSFAAGFVIVLSVVTITGGVFYAANISGEGRDNVVANLSNLVFALACVFLLFAGLKASYGVKALLSSHQESATRQQRDRFRRVLRNTAITVRLATFSAGLLIPVVTLAFVFKLTPQDHPSWYLVFVFVTHVVIEGTLSATMYYSTRLPDGVEGFLQEVCCCKKQESPEVLAMLESQDDYDGDSSLASMFSASQHSNYPVPGGRGRLSFGAGGMGSPGRLSIGGSSPRR